KEGVLVGYRWWDARGLEPAFPFGWGLSYTTFAFRHMRVEPDVGGTLPLRVSVDVTNTGSRTGTAVPQLYIGLPQPKAGVVQPPKQLKGIDKLSLAPGETRRVTFAIDQRALSYWDTDANDWQVAPGCYALMVGSSSREITNGKVVAIDGASCEGAVLGVRVAGVCRRSVLIHLNHVRGRIRRVVAFVSGTRRVVRLHRDAVRVPIAGTAGVTKVRLLVRTSRGTVRLTRRFHTCVRR